MSRRASSDEIDDFCVRCSPESFCSTGSMPTLLLTSVRRVAVISRSSLWRMEGYPPQVQLKACSTVNGLPQTHIRGREEGSPVASQIADKGRLEILPCAWRAKPWEVNGRAVSQLLDPFSLDASKILRRRGGNVLKRCVWESFSTKRRAACTWSFLCLLLG